MHKESLTGDSLVSLNNPGRGRFSGESGSVTEAGLKSTNEEEPDAHRDGSTEEHGATSPAVDVHDGRDGGTAVIEISEIICV